MVSTINVVYPAAEADGGRHPEQGVQNGTFHREGFMRPANDQVVAEDQTHKDARKTQPRWQIFPAKQRVVVVFLERRKERVPQSILHRIIQMVIIVKEGQRGCQNVRWHGHRLCPF